MVDADTGSAKDTGPGAAIYNKFLLHIYDLSLGLNNQPAAHRPDGLEPNLPCLRCKSDQTLQSNDISVDVLQPITLDIPGFDSISLYYLLHCLPGTMKSKTAAFANLKPLLNEGGVLFGSTILGEGRPCNFLGRLLLKVGHAIGTASNAQANLGDLEQGLSAHFAEYKTQIVGHVALFMGRK